MENLSWQQIVTLNKTKADLFEELQSQGKSFDYTLPQNWLNETAYAAKSYGITYEMIRHTTVWAYPEEKPLTICKEVQRLLTTIELNNGRIDNKFFDLRKIITFEELAPAWQEEAISILESQAEEALYIEPLPHHEPVRHALRNLTEATPTGRCTLDRYQSVITLSNNAWMELWIDSNLTTAWVTYN